MTRTRGQPCGPRAQPPGGVGEGGSVPMGGARWEAAPLGANGRFSLAAEGKTTGGTGCRRVFAGARPLYFSFVSLVACLRARPRQAAAAGRARILLGASLWAKNRVSVLAGGPRKAALCPPPSRAALLCVVVGVLRRGRSSAPCCLHSWRPALTAVRTCLRCSISARSPASRWCSAVL